MIRRTIPLFMALLLSAACMTAGQKKDKADSEAAVASAGAAIAAARLGGGEAFSATRMRSAESDFRMAQAKLKEGDWEEARRRARLAAGVANDVLADAEIARKKAAAEKPTAFKAGQVNKKGRTGTK